MSNQSNHNRRLANFTPGTVHDESYNSRTDTMEGDRPNNKMFDYKTIYSMNLPKANPPEDHSGSTDNGTAALGYLSSLAADEDIEDVVEQCASTTTATTPAPPVPGVGGNSDGSICLEKRKNAGLSRSSEHRRSRTTSTTTTRSRTAPSPTAAVSVPSAVGGKHTTAEDATSKSSSRHSTPREMARGPQGTRDKNYVLISRTMLALLSVLATVGSVVGTAGFAIGLAVLIEERHEASSSSVARVGTDDNLELEGPDNGEAARSLLDEIYDRGYLKCGLGPLQPGFFYPKNGIVVDPTSLSSAMSTSTEGMKEEEQGPQPDDFVGCDIDLCSALAAAIFGDALAFEPHAFSYSERWSKLDSGAVDVVFRSTYNMERDVYIEEIGKGVEFTSPYFYDGLGFGGLESYVDCAENGVTNGTCADLRICVFAGTTFQDVVESLFPTQHIVVVGDDLMSVFPTGCNVLAAEQIQISEATVRQQGYTGDYIAGTKIVSKEPIGLVSRKGDPTWKDFMEFVFQSLVFAEQQGISRITANQMGSTSLFGPRFESMFQNAVAARGNYGEIYNANLQNFLPRSGLNGLNTDGAPLIWALPFGNLEAAGPKIEKTSPTAIAIKKRGFLNCGTTLLAGFAELDRLNKDYVGVDVDLCRAVSAALFDGVDRTVFYDIGYTFRWESLLDQDVDVLALSTTWTVGRDVKEPSTQRGFSFADPYVYVWHNFGGVPQYVQCADNLDVVSPECQDLRICVIRDTTWYDETLARFGNDFYIVGVGLYTEMAAGLRDGLCNVIYHTIGEVQESRVRAAGYGDELPYVVGDRQYSVEPLAMVTAEEDPLWSAFVRWIFWALVYAEEQGITQATAELMPRPTIFGPLRTNAFFHAVNAVGNYGEIYERNMESVFKRSGPNRLNDNTQPRIIAVPGFELS